MGVRALLPFGVGPRTGVPEYAGGGAREGAVGAQRDGRDAPGAVVGGQDVPGVDAEVGGALAADGDGGAEALGVSPVTRKAATAPSEVSLTA